MNDKELIQQLNELPREIEAKDQWAQIKAAIEQQTVTTEPVIEQKNHKSWRMPLALAASVMLVTFVALIVPNQWQQNADGIQQDFAQQKTLQSLQQANSQYYQALGQKMAIEEIRLPTGVEGALSDLRRAQKAYRIELANSPQSSDVYKKLIETYETERSLLKDLLS
ncbi:MAG: hypothetical protein HWE16_02095 [Gammaproteobacteria bacterium]|nr:hypothetical protein [Gammaproteobacteria bacterium]